MGEPLKCVMGPCFVGRRVVTDKISIMLHCWADVERVDTFVIPLGLIVIKENNLCTNGRHWRTVVVKDSMHLVVSRNQRVDPGWSDKVDNDVNLG